jgi:hypothetical protein
MITHLVYLALSITASVCETDAESIRARKLLKSDNYTVTWGAERTFDKDSELEIGDANGHGFTFGWLRFQPANDNAAVLSIRLDLGRHPYNSKWPPDRAPVTVKSARMKLDAYAALLRELAVVDSAKLQRIERNSSTFSTNDFWVHVRLTANKKTLIDLNWAGYESSHDEFAFARPRAAVSLARDVVKTLDFKDHVLTAEERRWASSKFARDLKSINDLDCWFARERCIITIGVVGDTTALPTLHEILEGDRKPKDRCAYYAINAVTRLTKNEVREKPVEEMDVEKTRRKILELLRDQE